MLGLKHLCEDTICLLWKEGVTYFFENVGTFSMTQQLIKIMNRVLTLECWTKVIIGVRCATLNKKHCEAIALQLIAAELIC